MTSFKVCRGGQKKVLDLVEKRHLKEASEVLSVYEGICPEDADIEPLRKRIGE
jgi:hypothetical protein